MRIYHFSCQGLYLSGNIIVVDARKDSAFKVAKAWAIDNFLDPTTVAFINSFPTDKKQIIFEQDGDY